MSQQLLKGSLLHVRTSQGEEGVVFANHKENGTVLIAYLNQPGIGCYPFKDLVVLKRKDMHHNVWYDKTPTPIK
jgi:hypothetical protein